jgi:uncharacterized membrane protein
MSLQIAEICWCTAWQLMGLGSVITLTLTLSLVLVLGLTLTMVMVVILNRTTPV